MGLRQIRRSSNQRNPEPQEVSGSRQGKAVGYLARRLRGWRVSQSSIATKSRTTLTRNRTPQQVTTRLDALIQKIHKIQAPYMHGEKPVDIMLVRPLNPPSHPQQIFFLTTPTRPDRPRPPPPRIRKTMAPVPHGNPVINDDGARGHWHPQVPL